MESSGTDEPIPNRQQILAALQLWPSNQQGTVDQLRPLADDGDKTARAVLAYMLGPQTGRWSEGLPYARQAVADGATFIGYIYGQNLVGQPDASLRAAAAEFLERAAEDGWPADPFSALVQVTQQGDLATGSALLDLVNVPRTQGARRRWDELLTEVTAQRREVENAAAAVGSQKERIIGSMEQDAAEVSSQRRTVEQLAEQVGVLANRVAGEAIAADYAERAQHVEKTARRYTTASIVLAVVIAIGATIATVLADRGTIASDAASKAAVAIPLVALNLYLGRLAAQYRKEAVELRHIELQFNTANPFLSVLDEPQRKEVLAHLALRFFPGQALPGGGTASSDGDLAQLATAAILERVSGISASKRSSAPDA